MNLNLLYFYLFNIIIKFCYVKGLSYVNDSPEVIPEECKIYNNLNGFSIDYNCCNEKCKSQNIEIPVCDEQKQHVKCMYDMILNNNGVYIFIIYIINFLFKIYFKIIIIIYNKFFKINYI